jgi:hypothetical protein
MENLTISYTGYSDGIGDFFFTLGEMVQGDRRDAELMRRLSQMTAFERDFPLFPERGLEHAVCAAATIALPHAAG